MDASPAEGAPPVAGVRAAGGWLRLLAAVGAVFALFQLVAARLGSTRGEAGVAVGGVVVLAVLAAERWLVGGEEARRSLRAPERRGILAAAAISLLLVAVIPVVARATGGRVALRSGWLQLLPGLFAQAGIAEEILFRGLLFGHVRRGRSFPAAVLLAALPFTAAHLFLFSTLPWHIAAASVLLAAVLSVPLARLFELGGGTIWGPAAVHFVVQGAIKVAAIEAAPGLPLVWFAASAAIPFLAFAVPAARPR